jgi:hypothetical protein
VWGIDHGLTFNHVPKLRTVIWDYCGDPIRPDLLEQIQGFRADPEKVRDLELALKPLLSRHELEALFQRWDRLLAVPCYPQLDPYRNVPWPPF